ncbi:MAG: NADH-quinone oxidoreductase subunit J [Actinomycetaceae bacterium]|nr:NADH-quinone oxidoreductase subunit J [Actinomycetaceae bacterium]
MNDTTIEISTGEMLLFAVLAVVMIVLSVYGLLITRRAVYSAICVIANMVCLAFLYTMLQAPFMGVVQVAVYTGAILMMFLFVLMMIGVDAADSTHETLRGPRIFAALGSVGFVIIAVGAVMAARTPDAAGLAEDPERTNPSAIASAIIGDHVLTMELTGALLIVAALGAMTLTHRQATRKKLDQPALQEAKMQAYAATGRHIGQKPPTGVYAESNSAADPALTAGGEVAEESISRVLRIRGQIRTVAEVSPITVARAARGELEGPGVNRSVGQAGMAGMPGEAAPDYDGQPPALLAGGHGDPAIGAGDTGGDDDGAVGRDAAGQGPAEPAGKSDSAGSEPEREGPGPEHAGEAEDDGEGGSSR